ncbi:hypothetical protein RJ640_006143 [Escallonia rubra]|uniref:Xylanase inhibitor N-terminal domain-containing protein n=1 Tax=Escallonia rubra TaxID=112253 RepID=A0AA88UVK7_9ASTE|nr:hypothetical protein RJ640_006143 [Escallonia rubra]
MCRCGYHQEFLDTHTPPPKVDGVLGLGNGKASIVSQLSDQGVIPKVTGHCLGGQGGGYLFLGNAPVSSPGLLRAQMSSQSVKFHDNMLAPADLLYGEQPLDYGLYVAFDSGSTYTYFESQAYRATLQQITTHRRKLLHLMYRPAFSYVSQHNLPDVYERLIQSGKKPGFFQLLATKTVSAVWHGLYPGYIIFFVQSAVMIAGLRGNKLGLCSMTYSDG